MLTGLVWSALLMGLAGGPHCLVMCAAPCAAVVARARRGERAQGAADSAGARQRGSTGPAPRAGVQPLQPLQREQRAGALRRALAFHAGRLAGYAGAGALAALAMDGLAWLTQHSAALRPVWALAHAAVLAWGLMLLLQARQPDWTERAGRALWQRIQPLLAAPAGVLAAGLVWALLPCGLLYSALLVAALAGGPAQGALTMTAFALASGAWLVLGPRAFRTLAVRLNAARAQWGTRLAGGLLSAAAAWALWSDLIYKSALWCRALAA